MISTEQIYNQLDGIANKISQRFSKQGEEASVITDIHFRITKDKELIVVDDDENEIERCAIGHWIVNREQFYDELTSLLQTYFHKHSETINNIHILKPFSFVLEDENSNHIAELYLADDGKVIIGNDLMTDLDEDLNTFLNHLLEN